MPASISMRRFMGAFYAIGRTMELLALTVFGDVSILPPLLNLSQISVTNLPQLAAPSPAAKRLRAEEPFDHGARTPTVLVLDADLRGRRLPEAEFAVAEPRRRRDQAPRDAVHQGPGDGLGAALDHHRIGRAGHQSRQHGG